MEDIAQEAYLSWCECAVRYVRRAESDWGPGAVR